MRSIHRSSLTAVIAVFCLAVVSHVAVAQKDLDVYAGVGASFSWPLAPLTAIPGIPSPGQLTFEPQNTSVDPFFIAGADLRFGSLIRLGGRAGYIGYHYDYLASERVPISTEDGGIYIATIGHELSMSFSTLWIEPTIRIEPIKQVGLQLGIPLAFPITSDYVQTQYFLDPAGLPFLDGSVRQVTGSGTVPGMATIVPGVTLQADGLFPMTPDGSLLLNPLVGATIQVGSWNTGSTQRTMAINVGLGVRYRMIEPPPPPEPYRDTVIIRDTVVILSQRVTTEVVDLTSATRDEVRRKDSIFLTIRERYQRLIPKPPAVLQASLRLTFETDVGGISKDAQLIVTKVARTRTIPFLPIVIFDSLETRIPNRYQRITTAAAETWSERLVMTNPEIHWQYHVLNIIGERMRRMPQTKIELIVYDDGTDEGTRIARERAVSVQRYVMSTFGISEKRLKIDVRHGQASQQPWVFIGDELRTVLKPLVVTDTVNETRLPKVRLSPDVVSEAGVRSWVVKAYNKDQELRSFEGRGATPATLIWDISENVSTDEALSSVITTTLSVTDNEGATVKTEAVRIAPQGATAQDGQRVSVKRRRVLRWIGADYLHTPDLELFGTSPSFDRIDVYPSASRREDFFVVNAPAVVHTVGEEAWFRRGLVEPERQLFDHVETYVKDDPIP